jgi:thiol-disulfide isomerase/thioredoxin
MLKISNNMKEIAEQDNAVVAFTASWCSPCKQLKPHFAKAAVLDNDIPYFVVDIDEIREDYLNKYNIMSVPQVFVMSKGEIVKNIKSRTSESILKEKEMLSHA